MFAPRTWLDLSTRMQGFIFGHILHFKSKMFKNENNSIVFASVVCTMYSLIKHGHDHYFCVT